MLSALLWSAGVLSGVLVALVAAAAGRKGVRAVLRARRDALEALLRPRLMALAVDSNERVPHAGSRRVRRCQIRLAWELLRRVRGDARRPLVELLEQLGEIARARRRTRHPGAVMRARAATLLGDVGDRAAVGQLVRLLADRDATARRAAAVALGQIGDPAAVPALLRALAGVRRISATVIAEALMEIGARGHEPLVAGLRAGSATERRIAATVLGLTGAVAAVSDLAGAARGDPDPGVRAGAIEALGRIGLSGGEHALAQTLGSSGVGAERAAAAAALGRIGDPAAIPLLAAALDDPDEPVARAAASALVLLGADAELAIRVDRPVAVEQLERLERAAAA